MISYFQNFHIFAFYIQTGNFIDEIFLLCYRQIQKASIEHRKNNLPFVENEFELHFELQRIMNY